MYEVHESNCILSSDNIKMMLAVMSMYPPINNTNKFIFSGVQSHTHMETSLRLYCLLDSVNQWELSITIMKASNNQPST